MIVSEKPDLDDVYLEHVGVKGMKWGVRKKRPDEGERSKVFTRKRVAIGLALTGGALAVASVMARQRGIKVSSLGPTPTTKSFGSLKDVLRNPAPSPFEMRIQAGYARHRNLMDRYSNQSLTDKSWRDAAKMSQVTRARFSGGKDGLTDIAAVRRNLSDPNYVWNL